MRSLQQLLDQNRRPPVSVHPGESVLEALDRMARHDIGAVLVTEGHQVVGIFSERDAARKVELKGLRAGEIQVREVMSTRVVCVTLSNTAEECMALMTDKHIRHLPVLDEAGKLFGVVSIGDLVKEVIRDQAFTIEQLTQYITG